jgi:hypothetical protein
VAFDPTTDALGLYVRADGTDYAGVSWPGTSSTGGSGSVNLAPGTSPSVAATVNGIYNGARFDGTTQFFGAGASQPSTVASASAGTLYALVWGDSGAPAPGANQFDDPALISDLNGAFGLAWTSSGWSAFLFSTPSYSARLDVAASANAYHLVRIRWDSSTIGLTVDNGAEVTRSIGALTNDGALIIGANFNSTAFFGGRLLELATYATYENAAKHAQWGDYVQTRYGLSLGFSSLAYVSVSPVGRGVAARGPIRHLQEDRRARRPGDAAPFLARGIDRVIIEPNAAESPATVGPHRAFRPNPLGSRPGDAAPFKAVGTIRDVRRFGAPNRGGVRLQFTRTSSAAYLPGDAAPFLAIGSTPRTASGHPAGIVGPCRDFTPTLAYSVAPSGAIAGTDGIVFGQSGDLRGAGLLAGSDGITFAQTADLRGAGLLAGTATITFAQTADVRGSGALVGTDAITFGQTGDLRGSGVLGGSSTIVFGQTGDLRGAGLLTGSDGLTFGQAATLTAGWPSIGVQVAGGPLGRGPQGAGPVRHFRSAVVPVTPGAPSGAIAGSDGIIFSQSGDLRGAGLLAGSATIVFSQSGDVRGAGVLTGTDGITFGQTGALAGAGKLAGSDGLTFGQTGDLRGAGALAGSDGITFGGTATIIGGQPDPGMGFPGVRGPRPFTRGPFIGHVRSPQAYVPGVSAISGTDGIVFGQSGDLRGVGLLAGTAAVLFGQTGDLRGVGTLGGTAALVFAQTGDVRGAGLLAGSAPVTFAQTGDLRGKATISGTGAIVFAASAPLQDSSTVGVEWIVDGHPLATWSSSTYALPSSWFTVTTGASTGLRAVAMGSVRLDAVAAFTVVVADASLVTTALGSRWLDLVVPAAGHPRPEY